MSTLVTNAGQVDSGVIINHAVLQNLFSPQRVEMYTPPPTGIDNLGITSTDSFFIPKVGEFKVDFSGYVRVARSKPSASDWVNAEVYTNLIEMKMLGYSAETGDIIVTLNKDYRRPACCARRLNR